MAQTALVAVARVQLQTERLLLQPIAQSHSKAILAAIVASRPELLPWMPWAKEPTLEGAREAAAGSRRDWRAGARFRFAMVERTTNVVLGVVGLAREGDDSVDLAYWIRSDHAGRGLTTEACRALIDWGAHTLGVSRITLWAGSENHASRRVAVKLGFTHLGPLDWQPDGGLGAFPAERYELIV